MEFKEISAGEYITNVDGIVRTFSISDETNAHIIVKSCFIYVKSTKFASLRPSSRRQDFLAIRNFLIFLDKFDYTKSNSKTLLYPTYFTYIRDTTRVKSATIWSSINVIIKALQYTLSTSTDGQYTSQLYKYIQIKI